MDTSHTYLLFGRKSHQDARGGEVGTHLVLIVIGWQEAHYSTWYNGAHVQQHSAQFIKLQSHRSRCNLSSFLYCSYYFQLVFKMLAH